MLKYDTFQECVTFKWLKRCTMTKSILRRHGLCVKRGDTFCASKAGQSNDWARFNVPPNTL